MSPAEPPEAPVSADNRSPLVGDPPVRTHAMIDRGLCGDALAMGPNTATVRLQTQACMAADARGLVHGGFIFGAADYAAMLAVNKETVVLGAATTRFLAPVRVGQMVIFVAERRGGHDRKHKIFVSATVGELQVFEGTFETFVLDHHVLDPPAT